MNLQVAGGSPSLTWPAALTCNQCPQPRFCWARGLKCSVSHTHEPWRLSYPLLPKLSTYTSAIMKSYSPCPNPQEKEFWGLIPIIHVIDEARVTQFKGGDGRAEKCDPVSWLSCYRPFSNRKFFRLDILWGSCPVPGHGLETWFKRENVFQVHNNLQTNNYNLTGF